MSTVYHKNPTKCPCCGWRTYDAQTKWCLDCGMLKKCAKCNTVKRLEAFSGAGSRNCKLCNEQPRFQFRCSMCGVGCHGEVCKPCRAAEQQAAQITPEMIRAATLEIQAGWSEAERYNRAKYARPVEVDVAQNCPENSTGRKPRGSDVKAANNV